MNAPLISVILPAYNAELYLKNAIDSILNQSFKDFELLVINDGSNDGTEGIILSYKDSRVIYIKNEINLGLIGTLNKGISLSKGKYLARMDADDISDPLRFEKQTLYLEENPNVVICSSSRIEFNDSNDKTHISFMPLDNISIRIYSIFSTPFTHPAVMMRRDTIIDNKIYFDSSFKYAEDYDFWVKLLNYGDGYNFKESLLFYRDTPNSQTSIGAGKAMERKAIISAIQQKALKELNIVLEEKDLDFIYILSLSDHIRQIDFSLYNVEYVKSFFNKLKVLLLRAFPKEKEKINAILGKRYLKVVLFNRSKLSLINILLLMNNNIFFVGVIDICKEKFRYNNSNRNQC